MAIMMTHRAKGWITNIHLLAYYYNCALLSTTATSLAFTGLNQNFPLFKSLQAQAQLQHFTASTFSTRRAMSAKSDTLNDEGLSNIGEVKEKENKIKESEKELINWKTKIDKSSKKSRHIRGSNYIQLATSVDNEPRCRTVVFRGFQKMPHSSIKGDATKCFKMITDARSQKVKQSNTCEIVWWFFQTKEQYRVRGTIQYIDSSADDECSAIRIQQWEKLTNDAREQFYWNDPSETYTRYEKSMKGGRDEEGNILPPPDNFLIMLVYPYNVDYLNLKSNYRQVDTLNDVDEWDCSRMNP